jgi:hypothetical protein
MADSTMEKAAAMLANALVSNTGSRQKASERAVKGFEKQTEGEGQLLWLKAYRLLRSSNPIPPYRCHIPGIENPHAVHYEPVPLKKR